ncbi:MAG: protein-glutamate O-methyltransferase CheR [Proteobacteria bacterium]|nr:protein-glutamate O-methyltransferase CheR [Pseudomonadota bacterium]
MNIGDFDLYKNMLKTKSGLTLTPDKAYLLDSRLTPIAKKWGFPSLDAMSVSLRGKPDSNMVRDIVEAMTTNETSFFRDGKPFDLFKSVVLPHMLKERSKTKSLKIWCAACSSGQEPYSLSMVLKENAPMMQGWNIQITATDISNAILENAKRAEYSQFEVQRGLPIQMLMRFFDQVNESWRLKEEIRKMVRFEHCNLLEDISKLGRFDVVFCRNVLIYFDEATKKTVLGKIAKQMEKDSFLFLGGAETVLGIAEEFKPMEGQRGLYILKDSAHSMQKPPASAAATR